MQKNIQNNKTNSSENMRIAFHTQNEVMDKIIDQMYNYDLYGRYKDNSYNTAANNPTSDDLSTNLYNNLELQDSMLDTLYNDAKRIKRTYNYNADMYRNQVNTNRLIKKEKDVVQKRYDYMISEITKNQRQHEIYQYHYYKHRAQLKIIKTFILLVIVLILLTFLNKKFHFAMNDTLYSVCIGICIAIYVIYTCKQLYDIYLRSEFVFDEYDTGEKPSINIDNDKTTDQTTNKKCKTQ